MKIPTIQSGLPLQAQSQEFKDYFNSEIMPKIDFADSCNQRDTWGRPSKWLFDDIVVQATYFTENENYNFNEFLIFKTE